MNMAFIKNFIKNKVFIISEIGVNHNGSVKLAKKLIDKSIEAGADAVKFQSFKASTLSSKFTPKAKYQLSEKKNETHYQMLKKLEFNGKKFDEIIKYCKKKNIKLISTPYNTDNIEYLYKKGLKIIKVASADLIDHRMHKLLSKLKNIEVIISTGMANYKEIGQTMKFYKFKKKNIYLLQCVSNYPSSLFSQNLNIINRLKQKFKVEVGFSDHTKGSFCSQLAVAAGAKIIERHFTLNKNMSGPDHKASLNPVELKKFIKKIREVEKILGNDNKICQNEEEDMKKVSRKSVVSLKKIVSGERLTLKNITCKRPGTGIPASNYFNILGKKIFKTVDKDQLILKEMFKK